jgi:outer membrane protein assembly factor BamB
MTQHRIPRRSPVPTLTAPARTTPALAATLISALLGGCSWFGDSDKPPLPGQRISVLQMESKLTPDPALAGDAVLVPAAVRNDSWPQAGGSPDHAMGHLELGATPQEVWRGSIGDGSGSRLRLLDRPVVADGRIFALDASTQVGALDEATGKRLWQVDLTPPDTRGSSFGGGVAVGEGLLFAATGYAELVAMNPADGAIVWRKHIPSPARGAPTVIKGRVFAQSLDNQTFAFSVKDGELLWSHTGILESAGLLGAVSPAADAGIVVVPYSSGEVFALRLDNGRSAWQDNLTAIRRAGALSGLSDIRGLPVIDHGLVLAVSHSGRTVAIDERTGARVWDQEIGGVDTPWPAGDFVFELTNDNQLVALMRRDGRIRWAAPLTRYEDATDKSTVVVWSGPVLAGDRLWLSGSTGELIGVSPASGEIVTRITLPGPAFLAPVVANGTLYVLIDDGTVVAYR